MILLKGFVEDKTAEECIYKIVGFARIVYKVYLGTRPTQIIV